MLPTTTEPPSIELLDAGVRISSGLETVEQAAVSSGMTLDALLVKLEDPDILAQIEHRHAVMRNTGRIIEARSIPMLDKVLDNIEPQLEGMSVGTALRVADLLIRLSGIQERRAAEIKRVAPDAGEKFSIHIILNGEDAMHPRKAKVIDVEDVEVSDV
jgi:hypothetical protein